MAQRIRIRDTFLLLSITIVPILLVAATLFWWEIETDEEGKFHPHILAASRQHRVPKELIKAVIWKESRFNSNAHGGADERGLMQVTPAAGMDWAKAERVENFDPDDLFDVRVNIQAGTWYLARALKRWSEADDPLPFALAEYNAGPVHARRWADAAGRLDSVLFCQKVDFPTTRQYIQDVVQRREYYRLHPAPGPVDFLKDRLGIFIEKLKKR
ncbi:MAG: transglycosylase SLT domain-containing protein [Candidatus Methylacidiphilales bacterium]